MSAPEETGERKSQKNQKKPTAEAVKGAIQLGVAFTEGNLTSKPDRDVLMQDFYVVESVFFPSEGSNLTPGHHYPDFRFKIYAPLAFRYFRELFGIRPDDYLFSMCNEPLIQLSNPGASSSWFYGTSDDEFIIKTVQHKEAEFLQKLLPGYYMNLNQNPRTLLPKFYGLYCVQCGGMKIRLVVMNNVLPRSVKMHYKYDLKGSTYKRRASRKERVKFLPTFKDLDFQDMHSDGLYFHPDTYSALMKTLQRDCQVLESFKIMDYSLLLGIHVLDVKLRERGGQGDSKRQKVLYSTALESIQGGGGVTEPHPNPHTDETMGGIPAKYKDEKLLIFLGIIDILQSYRLMKRVEHSWKALVFDADTVSVHRPGFYADRFLKFMGGTVFKKINILRGSSSGGNRTSLLPVRSASHEVLCVIKEERCEERKAQSLENLDENGTEFYSACERGVESHSLQSLVMLVKPDIIPSCADLQMVVCSQSLNSVCSSDKTNKLTLKENTQHSSRVDSGMYSSTLVPAGCVFRSESSLSSVSDSELDIYL